MTKSVRIKISIFLTLLLLAVVVFGVLPTIAFAESTEQFIKFEYLQRIDGTPFAHKVQTMIKVPVYANNTIKLADVKKTLQCERFGVMQSYCRTFEYDRQRNVYKAVYYKSVYLNAKTVDGNSFNYYLDCNLSYDDYFGCFVDDGIVDSGLYDFYLNRIYDTYPALDDYDADDIYGYWGMIVIPKGNDLNQAWADLFGTATTYSGVLEKFLYTRAISNEEYNKLLNDYQYGFLEILWKNLVGWVGSYEADYYMIYCDSQTFEAYIAENGADDINDNRGAVGNGLKDMVERFKDFFSGNKTVPIILGVLGSVLLLSAVTFLIYKLVVLIKKKNKK